METNKVIIESQLRRIVRQELEEFLLNEGIGNKVRTAALFSLLTLAGHQATAGVGKGDGGGGNGETIEQMVERAGMKQEILNQLETKLTDEDIQLLASKYGTLKNLQKQYDEASAAGNFESMKEIDSRMDNLFAGISGQARDRILNTGKPILQYVKSLSNEEIKDIGNMSDKETVEKFRTKALYHQLKPEVQASNLIDATTFDMKKIFSIASKEYSDENIKTGEELIINWAVNEPNISKQLPDNFDYVDIIKAVDNSTDYDFDSKLLNSGYTDKKVKEFSDKLDDISKIEIYSKDLKENRVRKLKKRLNELRGLYV